MATTMRAREFHVDSVRGSDERSGLSPTEAWQSLERVNQADLQAGDTVRFVRGGCWRGTLQPRSGRAGAPVTYTAYGEGDKPLLLGSVAQDRPADWVSAGANLWATHAEFRDGGPIMDCRGGEWTRHQEAGAQVEMGRQADAGGTIYRLACQNSGKAGNHVQLWGPFPEGLTPDPRAIFTFRFRARSTIPFRLRPPSVIRCRPPWTAYGTGTGSLDVTPEWQDFGARLNLSGRPEEARLHVNLGGILPAGAVFEFQPVALCQTTCTAGMPLPVDVGNIIFDHGKACGWKRWALDQLKAPLDYFYDGAAGRVVVYAERNPAELYRSVELALRRHIVSQGGAHHVVYDGLALKYGAAHGFGGGDTSDLVIRNCDIAYIGGGHQFTREDGHPVRFGNGIEFWGAARDNLVEGCRLWEIYDAALTNQGHGPTSKEINIVYRNNIIWNAEYSFEYWNNPETAETRNILFENNTCVNAGVVWSHAQRPDRNGSHLMFYTNKAKSSGIVIRHNVFYQSTEWGSRFCAGWDPRPEIDANLWYEPDGCLSWFFKDKLPAADIDGYRQKTGFDQHSVFADPGFVDVAAGDFRLRPDSPARRVRADGGPVGAVSLWQ